MNSLIYGMIGFMLGIIASSNHFYRKGMADQQADRYTYNTLIGQCIERFNQCRKVVANDN